VTFLEEARRRLNLHLPGLDACLAELPLEELERPGGAALTMFRECNGPALLIPADLGGIGATLEDAVHVQRALGARSPSLGIATTMHHFTVASLTALAAHSDGFEWAMLEAIASNRWLLSSAFAEGRSGQHILSPTMRGTRVEGGLLVNGTKKPCSLTWSMDLLSASVAVDDPDTGVDRMAVILLPASTEGIERRHFWNSHVLAAAESDEVRLTDAFVPEALVIYPSADGTLDPVHARGFASFEVLAASTYIGAASALVERVLTAAKGAVEERALLAIELEAATAALAHAAQSADSPHHESHLAGALCARYNAEKVTERVAPAAAALAGGMAFCGSSDVAYLLAASRALAFHPPSRRDASQPLVDHLTGGRLLL
jgi:alkylation response protein AidB-like acyl-CoA dehydrogenase